MSRRGERRAAERQQDRRRAKNTQPGAIHFIATHSGTWRIGDVEVAVHVLAGGMPVVEITAIETLLGLPESGLGAFLASLPGTDRVRFLRKPIPSDPLANREAFGLPAEKVAEMLIAYWQANNGTAAGAKAGEIVRLIVTRGMREMGHSTEGVDFLMAAATLPRRSS